MTNLKAERRHVHDWKPKTKRVLLYRHIIRKGKYVVTGAATGRDDFKQHVCSCGAVATYDLDRRHL